MLGSLVQPGHMIILLCVLIFFFGGRWFSQLGKGFAEAVRNFRRSKRS